MNTDLVKRQTPEEEELKQKKHELAALEAELAERELDLSTLEAELRAFERRYLRTVGILYAELDGIEAQIAELAARANPDNDNAQQRSTQARYRAEESARSVGDLPESKERDDFKPTTELKDLYRRVAKAIHPDLATDQGERARRTQLMAEANRAYEDGDTARLLSILTDLESSPEAVRGSGVVPELIRVIRKVAQLKERLTEIESRFVQLKQSDLYKLSLKVREAEAQNRDLLREMALKVQTQIESARRRYSDMTTNEPA